MDTKKFFQEIRKIIREEVNKAIDERVNLKTEVRGDNFKQDMRHSMRIQEEVKRAETKEKPSLTDLLNETRDGMVDQSRTMQFAAKDAPAFNRNMMAQMLGYGEMPSRSSSPIPTTDIDGKPVQQLDSSVETALTRDYSKLMKVISEKKSK